MTLVALKRLITLLLTLLVASVVLFVVMEVLPGDIATVVLGTDVQDDALAVFRAKHGLGRLGLVRYLDWMKGLLRGDLGESYTL